MDTSLPSSGAVSCVHDTSVLSIYAMRLSFWQQHLETCSNLLFSWASFIIPHEYCAKSLSFRPAEVILLWPFRMSIACRSSSGSDRAVFKDSRISPVSRVSKALLAFSLAASDSRRSSHKLDSNE